MTPDRPRPPARRLDRTLLAIAALVALALAGLHLAPPVRELEGRLFDLTLQARRSWSPSVAPEVVLVGVDEASEKAFPEPFSLWHRHFADVFAGLAQGGVRGVGVDFVFPTHSEDGLVPGGDAALVQGLLRLRGRAPVVLGVTVDGAFQARPIFPPFLAAAGPDGFGLVLAPADADGRLRRFSMKDGPGHTWAPTMTGVLARRLGVAPGDGLVDFSYGGPFTYVPFHRVAQWQRAGNQAALTAAFRNRVVLVGSVLPGEDRHPMAVDLAGWEADHGQAPGLTYHAQVLRCLLGKGLIRPVSAGGVWSLSLALAIGIGLLAGRPALGLLGMGVAWALLGVGFYLGIGRGWYLPPLAPAGAALAGLMGRSAWEAVGQVRARRWLQQAFSGHVSPAILREILAGRLASDLTGRRVPVCLLFSDIRNFTTLSEPMPPEAVIALLNRYFSRMAEAVHDQSGTVDKFMGDGLMAFFGAPEPLANPSLAAFQSARNMLTALAALNRERVSEGLPSLAIGIGLHYGEAAVGYVGSPARHEYTAIGDAVNLASRVEGLTRELGYPLLCTRTVIEQVGDGFGLVPLGEHPVRGRGPVELFGWRPASDDDPRGEA